MKTLRFIGMAVVAIIMSVNFVACSDDDDDHTGDKRLVSISWENKQEGYSDIEESKYEYDAQGRIIKDIYTDSDGGYEVTNYTYGDSKITATTSYGTETYVLNKGVVVTCTRTSQGSVSRRTAYEYDNENRLKFIREAGEDEQEVIWENDNIVEIEGSTYTYTDIPVSKGEYIGYHNIDRVLYYQGYFGKCSANLIKTETRYGETETFTYEIEDDYITKITSNFCTMKLTWQ